MNSAINGIDNTLFYAGDMKDILTQEFINQHGRPDVIITDPPRAGMHDDVINTILFAEPQRRVALCGARGFAAPAAGQEGRHQGFYPLNSHFLLGESGADCRYVTAQK